MITNADRDVILRIRQSLCAWLKAVLSDQELCESLRARVALLSDPAAVLRQELGRALDNAAEIVAKAQGARRQDLIAGPVGDLLRATSNALGYQSKNTANVGELGALCSSGQWEEAWLQYLELSQKDDWEDVSRSRGWLPKPLSDAEVSLIGAEFNSGNRASAMARLRAIGGHALKEMKAEMDQRGWA